MENTDQCTVSTYIYDFSMILPMARRMFSEDIKSNHEIAEEKQVVRME
jgi:hypothetical protein